MNPLDKYPNLRWAIYTIYWVVGVLLGAAAVYFSFNGGHVPVELLKITAVYGFLGVPLGFTAGQNVPKNNSTGKHAALD